MIDYPHIAGRLYGAPLALHVEKARVIEGVFRERSLELPPSGEVRSAAEAAEEAIRVRHERTLQSAAQVQFRPRAGKAYAVTESGIAIIPVLGTLVQRAGGLDALSGMMSYGSIGSRVEAAAQDADVGAILLEVDSMGGEVHGLAELADQLLAARQAKPLWAAINEQAYSAAYFIAAAAKRVTIPISGGTGSIGVIALHVDQSARDAKHGYAYTFVYAGARKKDFNEHEPLSDEARASLQGEIDRHYGLFVAHVARARGIDEKRVRATEAGILSPQVAKDGGFVDQIATFVETIELLAASVPAGRHSAPPAARAPTQQPRSEREPSRAQQLPHELAHAADDILKKKAAIGSLRGSRRDSPLSRAMAMLPNPEVGIDVESEVVAPRLNPAAYYAMWNNPAAYNRAATQGSGGAAARRETQPRTSLESAYADGLRRADAAGCKEIDRASYASTYAATLLRMELERRRMVSAEEDPPWMAAATRDPVGAADSFIEEDAQAVQAYLAAPDKPAAAAGLQDQAAALAARFLKKPNEGDQQ